MFSICVSIYFDLRALSKFILNPKCVAKVDYKHSRDAKIEFLAYYMRRDVLLTLGVPDSRRRGFLGAVRDLAAVWTLDAQGGGHIRGFRDCGPPLLFYTLKNLVKNITYRGEGPHIKTQTKN